MAIRIVYPHSALCLRPVSNVTLLPCRVHKHNIDIIMNWNDSLSIFNEQSSFTVESLRTPLVCAHNRSRDFPLPSDTKRKECGIDNNTRKTCSIQISRWHRSRELRLYIKSVRWRHKVLVLEITSISSEKWVNAVNLGLEVCLFASLLISSSA